MPTSTVAALAMMAGAARCSAKAIARAVLVPGQLFSIRATRSRA